MPIALALMTLIIVLIDLRKRNGLPPSEKYRLKFMRDC